MRHRSTQTKFLGNFGYVVALFLFFLAETSSLQCKSLIHFLQVFSFFPLRILNDNLQLRVFLPITGRISSHCPKTCPCAQWQVDSIFSLGQSTCKCLDVLDSTTYRRHYWSPRVIGSGIIVQNPGMAVPLFNGIGRWQSIFVSGRFFTPTYHFSNHWSIFSGTSCFPLCGSQT